VDRDAVFAQFRKHIRYHYGREVLKFIDICEEPSPLILRQISSAVRCKTNCVTKRPPNSEELSSPSRPLATLSHSMDVSNFVNRPFAEYASPISIPTWQDQLRIKRSGLAFAPDVDASLRKRLTGLQDKAIGLFVFAPFIKTVGEHHAMASAKAVSGYWFLSGGL
jgi:hypothetical protein